MEKLRDIKWNFCRIFIDNALNLRLNGRMGTDVARWMKTVVKHALTVRRIVFISGARQCGKSTLMADCLGRNPRYFTMDDERTLISVQDDPWGFVHHTKGTLGIDEVQKYPPLINAIKMEVDKDRRKGQFLLSGSSDIRMMSEVKESLAGRIKRVPLRTFAIGEINGAKPVFLARAQAGDFPRFGDDIGKEGIVGLALKGGYPEVQGMSRSERNDWARGYCDSLLERDLKDLATIRRHDAMEELLRLFAAWSGKYMDQTAICNQLDMKWETFDSYASALRGLYLYDKIEPWMARDYSRAGRRPKCFMRDSGLMSALLKWDENTLMSDTDRTGKLVETFIYHELASIADCQPDVDIFHYRDRDNREVDFVVRDNETGHVLAIDAKAGTNVGRDDFRHIRWFRETLLKDVPSTGIVLYSGRETLSFGNGLYAVPSSVLWAR